MEYRLEQVAPDSYVLAAWDSSWDSFNNSYIILRPGGGASVIDTGRAGPKNFLQEALARLGIGFRDVKAVVLTHAHPDHTGGAADFPHAKVYLHPGDWSRLGSSGPPLMPLPDSGFVEGLQCIHAGVHTPGSAVLFDPVSHSLFCGDIVCFFGRALSPPECGMISTDPEIRRHYIQQLAGWVGTPEGQTRFPAADFVRAIQAMRQFPAEYLCTGHGIVLAREVDVFLREMEQALQFTSSKL